MVYLLDFRAQAFGQVLLHLLVRRRLVDMVDDIDAEQHPLENHADDNAAQHLSAPDGVILGRRIGDRLRRILK